MPPKAKRAPEAPGRRLEYLDLAGLKAAKRNPKKHNTEMLADSLERFGYSAPVLVDERTGRLVAGHGRVHLLRQLQKEGKPPPDGVSLGAGGEWLVPVVRGWSSKDDQEAEAYLLADNKVSELGGWDEAGVDELLRDLFKGAGLKGTGFTTKDIADADDLLAEPAGDESGQLKESFAVLVSCSSEKEQAELLEELTEEGYECRSLIS